MNRRTLLGTTLACCLFLTGCQITLADSADEPDRRALDAQLDEALAPMVDAVAMLSRGQKLSVPGFYHQPSGRTIPMSDYLTPRLLRAMSERRITVVERLDIEKIAEEHARSTSDLFDPSAADNIGRLSGADLLLLCPAVSVDPLEYQVNWKLADVVSGEILTSGFVLIDRRALPTRYGGALAD